MNLKYKIETANNIMHVSNASSWFFREYFGEYFEQIM